MIWTLYRWTWRVKAPLYLGLPPAGSLNRTRLFVPVRTLWGALTAELARHEADAAPPEYEGVGLTLRKDARLGYLFPAETIGGKWQAWLSRYESGLVWTREDGLQSQSDRAFRRRVLNAKPGTSIDPEADTAEDGSLRETECIQTKWRAKDGLGEPAVAMTGYVFLRGDSLRARLDVIQQLFVGGDTRYGLGLIERSGGLVEANCFFGHPVVALDMDSPRVVAAVVRGHAGSTDEGSTLRGDRERVLGWNDGKLGGNVDTTLWCPGSSSSCSRAQWSIDEDGFWRNISP